MCNESCKKRQFLEDYDLRQKRNEYGFESGEDNIIYEIYARLVISRWGHLHTDGSVETGQGCNNSWIITTGVMVKEIWSVKHMGWLCKPTGRKGYN